MSAEDNSWRIMELRARFGAEPRNVPRHFQFSSTRWILRRRIFGTSLTAVNQTGQDAGRHISGLTAKKGKSEGINRLVHYAS